MKVKWAQDHRRVLMTISAPGVGATEPRIECTEDGSVTIGTNGEDFSITLAAKLDSEHQDTQWTVKPNSIDMTLRKAEKGFWPFLLTGGKSANKRKDIETDWDRWVDEDECEDAEDDAPVSTPTPPVPFESSEAAALELSPLSGDGEAERDVFQGLKIEEKMVLFATMWNSSREDEREAALHRLVELVDGEDAKQQQMNSADIKGSAVLGDRDTSVYPAINIQHLQAWMDAYKTVSKEEKVAAFERCWGWCDDHEKRLTMAGLT